MIDTARVVTDEHKLGNSETLGRRIEESWYVIPTANGIALHLAISQCIGRPGTLSCTRVNRSSTKADALP